MIGRAPYYINSLDLPEDTKRIMELTAERTGKGFELKAQASDLSDTWASVKVAARDMPAHIILYHPAHVEHLPYLVAHECGHVIRLYGVPTEQRRLPGISVRHRRAFVYAIGKDIERFHSLGLPESALGELTSIWHAGIVRQLTNVPADMRIERWLYEEHPGLREYQVSALLEQLGQNTQVLSSQVMELTPKKIYDVSNGLNAAYARYLSFLLSNERLYDPYSKTEFERVGKELADYQWISTDIGYKGDVQAIKRWSRYFGLNSWWEWRKL